MFAADFSRSSCIAVPICALLLAVASIGAATAEDRVDIHWDTFFEKRLSAYNLFENPVRQIPNRGLIPYDVVTPLFSDYAEKARFFYVPEGTAMEYDSDGAFRFPIGSALVKTFYYPLDFRESDGPRRLVETRLMIHTPGGWKGAAYLWNEDQTDAELKVAGKQLPVEWIDVAGNRRSTGYIVPNMNHCNACHRGFGETGPLGIQARHVNRDYAYPDGARRQLEEWSARGVLKGLPEREKIPTLPKWDDGTDSNLHGRALAYFDVNCSHCHNEKGLASSTRLNLAWSQRDPHKLGVYYRPTAAGNASRGRYFAVVPGDPEASFLLHRLRSTEPNVRMPEVGRTVVHEEGVALIRAWIEQLPR